MHDYINQYFANERRELIAIFVGSVLLTTAVAILFLVARDTFSKGVAATVVVSAVLLSGTGASLMKRDSSDWRQLLLQLTTTVLAGRQVDQAG